MAPEVLFTGRGGDLQRVQVRPLLLDSGQPRLSSTNDLGSERQAHLGPGYFRSGPLGREMRPCLSSLSVEEPDF
jgi:hypothetical protein